MNPPKGRYHVLSAFALVLAGFGAVLLFYLYANARMPHFRLSGTDYWRAILTDVVFSPAVILLIFGLAMVFTALLIHVVFLAKGIGLAKPQISSGFAAGLVMVLVMMVVGVMFLLLLG